MAGKTEEDEERTEGSQNIMDNYLETCKIQSGVCVWFTELSNGSFIVVRPSDN